MSFTLNLINQASDEAREKSQKSQDRREHEVRDILQRHLRRWGGRVGLCLEEVRTIIQNRTDKANKMQLTYSGTLKVQWPLRSPPFLAALVAPRKSGYLTGPFCSLSSKRFLQKNCGS